MSGISTHMLDVARGKPATGVRVSLEFFAGPASSWTPVAEAWTDADGRCRPLLPVEQVRAGIYRLTFLTGPYFDLLGQPTLYPEVTVTFAVAPDQRDYHIPLLLSPFGYSTYRGT